MIKIAIFGSGNGSNFHAIAKAIANSEILNCQISFMHSNNLHAKIAQKAIFWNIPSHIFALKNFTSKLSYEQKLLELLSHYKIDMICLAGYMQLLSKDFLTKFGKPVLNIHPSLLPKYPGKNAIEQAYFNKEKLLGVTVHFVDEGMDTGQIILQKSIPIGVTLEETTKKIHILEHKLYSEAIQKIINSLANN